MLAFLNRRMALAFVLLSAATLMKAQTMLVFVGLGLLLIVAERQSRGDPTRPRGGPFGRAVVASLVVTIVLVGPAAEVLFGAGLDDEAAGTSCARCRV